MTPEDARRDLAGFVRFMWDEGPVPVLPWQWAALEAYARAREENRRARMRTDGWVKRAADELRKLEESANQELEVLGVDWAAGPDRTVYACACGFEAYDLEDLANHAIRGHRWPESDGTL